MCRGSIFSQACGASCEQCQKGVGTRGVPGQEACSLPVGGQRCAAGWKRVLDRLGTKLY